MKYQALLVGGIAIALGLVAYAGQRPAKGVARGGGQIAVPVGEPRVELHLTRIEQWLSQLKSGMAPETRAEILDAHRKRLIEYRGTEVKPRPESRGDLIAIQEELSKAFARVDPLPNQRLAHFQWCLRPDLVHTGWYGVFQDIAKVPDGWKIIVAVSPRLESIERGGVAFTSDQHIEEYLYSARGLTFVGGQEPPIDRRGSLMFD